MTLEAFFDQLPLFDAMEIAPDKALLSINTYKKIISHTKNHHFHVPYFVEPMKYDFSSEHYQSDYTKLLSIIESLRQYSVKTPSIVIHGGKILSDKQTAYDKTRQGLDFLLNFIEKKRLDFSLVIETLQSSSGMIGSTEDIHRILNEFQDPRLSICLDINHYYHDHQKKPDDQLLKYVSYVHLHHEHDTFTTLPKEALDFHLACPHNLEILMSACNKYKETLVHDHQAFIKNFK